MDSMQLEKGARLGPYEVMECVGAGGMGEVYRAVDTRLDRSVAIKVLPAAVSKNAELKVRFEREAKAISSLNHPHICTLHDIGEIDGSEYLVMEFCEGESLADRLKNGPLPIEQVIRYGEQIASALHRAHQHGIVHRDLKPGNIMITRSGAKLLDFGLAKTAAEAVEPPSVETALPTAHKPLTEEGTILGTFQYMAPEQVEGKPADGRTDIFALGAVLHEMATGSRAFEGSSRASLIAAIMDRQPPPISTLQPLTPPALDHVVRKCLEKDPEDRWQSAHDVATELRWISEAGSQAGVASPVLKRRKSRERALWVAALVLMAILAGLAGWLIPRPVPETRVSFEIPGSTDRYSELWNASISPDGSRIAFMAAEREGRPRLWIRPLDSLEASPLTGPLSSRSFFWSHDGSSIAYFDEGNLMKISASGGPPQPIAEIRSLESGAWSPDGVILLTTGETPLSRIDPGSSSVRTITTLDAEQHEFAHSSPTFLPDGRRFLFTASMRHPDRRDHSQRLYAGSLDSAETTFIGEIGSEVEYVEPGYLLAVRDGTLLAYPFDVDELEVTGDPRTVLANVAYFKPTGEAGFSVSSSGVLVVAAPAPPGELHLLDMDGKSTGSLDTEGAIGNLRVSPDGSRVAVAVEDPKLGTLDIWLYGLDRRTKRRLTLDSGWENHPVWTPDGSRLLYAWDRIGWPDIYVRTIDGAGEDELIVAEPDVQFPRDVSPDGKWLLYFTRADISNNGDLWLARLDSPGEREPFVASPFVESWGRFSPDGRFVAYQSNASGEWQVYVKPFPGPGSARQISLEQAGWPRWSADGTRLLWMWEDRMMSVRISPESGAPIGEPEELFTSSAEIGAWEPLPNGEGFVAEIRNASDSAPLRVYLDWKRLIGE